MFNKYLGYDQVELTYKQFTLVTVSVMIASLFLILFLLTWILHIAILVLTKRTQQKGTKTRVSTHSKFENDSKLDHFDDSLSEEKSDYDAFEIPSLSHIDYNTINSSKNMVEEQKAVNDQKYVIFIKQNEGYIPLKLWTIWSELCTLMSLLLEIDVLAGLGYLDVTSVYFIGKYLIWISFIGIVYLRTKSIFGTFSILAIFYCSSVTFFGSGIWLASHNQSLDGYKYGMFKLSTSFMRSNYASTWPKDKVPWITYLTLPENSVNEMFVNFHINQASCGNTVWKPIFKYTKYDSIHDESSWIEGDAVLSEYESLPTESESRNIFTTLLKNLEENTEYGFSVSIPDQTDTQIYFFKTINSDRFTIVNGGDIGINEEARQMNTHGLNNIDPDLIMIGGDISYDNNFPEWYRATDQILIEIPHFKTFSNNHIKLIPMIMSPGNHDFGMNSINHIQLTQNKHEPLFKHYYPQNTDSAGKVPSLLDKNAYFYHLIGDSVLIISLDSGYVSDIDGAQKQFLENILSKYSNVPIKIVHYHEPIYPSWSYDENKYTRLAKKHWVPLFEQYNVTVVFENHAHRLKRTYPLINGQKSENGVYYVGDGAWGAIGSPCESINTDIIQVDKIVNHVWIVDVQGTNQVNLKAIGLDQQILDSFTINLN